MMEKKVSEGYKLVTKRRVDVVTLANILSEHAQGKEIDFISLDTEGFDYKVLLGNDWGKYKPKVLCIEKADANVRSKIESFLIKQGYKKEIETVNNDIFSCLA